MTSQPTLAGRQSLSEPTHTTPGWWNRLLSGGNDSAGRKNDAGRSEYHLMWSFLCIELIFQKSRISFEKNGGDDETRTRRPLR
jgi:hypothetical protein